MIERKPPAAMQSREPKSIRFTDDEWQAFIAAARLRGIEVSTYVRQCAITGNSFIAAQEAMQSLKRATA